MKLPEQKTNLLIYTGQNGDVKIDVFLKDKTVSQKTIAELFGKERSVITKHLKNIFETGELDEKAMCRKCTLVIQINRLNSTTSMPLSQSATG